VSFIFVFAAVTVSVVVPLLLAKFESPE